MNSALIGYSGFVGKTLLRQYSFERLFRSTNINEIDHQIFDCVVCAAAPAQKWIANREPEADLQNIQHLIGHLSTIQCRTFVLISTVDVFKTPIGVTEDTQVNESGLHPYGLHRRYLETFIESRFVRHLIVRLPGLVGLGLGKNVIFDLLNDNNLDAIDSRSIFQFYPMVNLWYDIQTALRAQLSLVHLSAEPISVAEVAREGFGRLFEHTLTNLPAHYDFQSNHSELFGGRGAYQYSKRETLQAIRAYAQSEPVTLKAANRVGQ